MSGWDCFSAIANEFMNLFSVVLLRQVGENTSGWGVSYAVCIWCFAGQLSSWSSECTAVNVTDRLYCVP